MKYEKNLDNKLRDLYPLQIKWNVTGSNKGE
jgi:hypothetical protein